MYKCQKCNQHSQPGESLNRIVTKTREKTYENRLKKKDTYNEYEIKVSKGFEIVEEIGVCKECVPADQKLQVENANKTKAIPKARLDLNNVAIKVPGVYHAE